MRGKSNAQRCVITRNRSGTSISTDSPTSSSCPYPNSFAIWLFTIWMRPAASTTRMPFGSASISISRCRADASALARSASTRAIVMRNQWTRVMPTALPSTNVARPTAPSRSSLNDQNGDRKKYQAATPDSRAVNIAGPRPATKVTRRIAGRKRMKPRCEYNQVSSASRRKKLIRKAARAIA